MAFPLRVIVSHIDSAGKTLTHFGTEQFLVSATTNDENGITTALSNNSKVRGARIVVHSVANLDKQHQGVSLLS